MMPTIHLVGFERSRNYVYSRRARLRKKSNKEADVNANEI
jgi:hypothetical protein